jgi:hypothetical protein
MLRLFMCFVLFANSLSAFGFETDQYNLPAQPLADIGGEVTQYVEANIRIAAEKINREISLRESCLSKLEKSPVVKCDAPEKEREKLALLRSEETVAREVYKRLGDGMIPFTKAESWIESHDFKVLPARFKTKLGDSIFLRFPIDLIGQSPTVKLYETEFGTDKIAHFFQQGYTYYEKYHNALLAKQTHEKAIQKAVEWGQKTERTYYGTLMSGVYSNADLYANYAGMKFYFGLTQKIFIGETERPPTLIMENGLWTFNDENILSETLLKPFISEHLNEAFNPSIFTNAFGFRASVRRMVRKKSCPAWREKFPNLSANEADKIRQNLKFWNGEDYGYTDSRNFITIAETCFSISAN